VTLFFAGQALFFSRWQNQLMRLRRRKHTAAQVSMGMSTNWCFRISLRWRRGRFGLVSFLSFFRFLRFFLPFLSVFIFVRRHDHSKRPRPVYRFLCVFALPSTYINCVISESLHPLFFRVRVLRGLSAARSCVPAIDAILFYFRSQRDDDSAVISFFIILATYIFSYDDDDPLVVYVGGADDMIRRPLCVCLDLDSSPPTLGCILCAVLCLSKSFFSFSSFGLVLFCFVFFCSLPSWPSTLWFRVRVFSSSSLRYRYIPLTGGVGGGEVAAVFLALVCLLVLHLLHALVFSSLFSARSYPSFVSEQHRPFFSSNRRLGFFS
jgi:hypothetical protein